MYRNRRSYHRKKSSVKPLLFVLFALGIMVMKTYDTGLSPKDAAAESLIANLPSQAADKAAVDDGAVSETTAVDDSLEHIYGPMLFEESLPDEPETVATALPTFIDQDFIISAELTKGNVIDDRDRLNKMLTEEELSAGNASHLKQKLSSLAGNWLFSSKVLSDDTYCQSYEVQPGDALSRIARKNDVPYEFIMRLNNISNARSLRAGQTIKVVKGPFHCKVDLSERTLDLYLRNMYIKSFSVGVGSESSKTPTGSWLVKSGKIYDTADSAMGTRRIRLEGKSGSATEKQGIAIHGSSKSDGVGTASTDGSIKMRNKDVEMIFDMLLPGMSKVTVAN